MDIKKIPITKSDKRGIIYDCDKINFIVRKKGTISADHSHPEGETFFLIDGEIKITVGKKTKTIKALAKVSVPPDTYHKLVAITDIKLLYYRA